MWGNGARTPQFCSDRPKTSDLDDSDQGMSIPVKRKNIGSKTIYFIFFQIRSYFPTYTPFSTFSHPGKRQIFIRSKSVKKKSGSQLQPKKVREAKNILQTKYFIRSL